MVFHKEQREICKKALDTFGIDKQLDIAIEEMAELTKAIIKHRRYASRETYENLCEETADVSIMIEQIFLSTKCDDVAKYATAKIERLKQRLDNLEDERKDLSDGACSSKAINRYEYIKQLPVDKMAAVIAGMIMVNVVSVTGEPINAIVKKIYIKQVVEWLSGRLEPDEKV